MLNPDAKLNPDLFSESVEKKPTRDGFGAGTIEAGKENKNVVVLCADLKESTRAEWFEKEFPERFIEMGVAEQNMAATAAGFAALGKIPYIASYAAFSPGRNYEHIRTTIALNEIKVIIGGMHAGVSVGPDGATHQMLEDIGLMRGLPRMRVVAPCDAEEARKATVLAARADGPTYIRYGRAATPVITTTDTPFEFGTALTLWKSARPRITIVSTGSLTRNALVAARALDAEGIGTHLIHLHTIKPIDTEALVASAKETGQVVTIEEHQIAGGMGSAVAETLSLHCPTPITRLGINDSFGQSGEPDELLAHYGLDSHSITKTITSLL